MNSYRDAKVGSGGSGGGTGVLYGSSSDYTTYGGNGGSNGFSGRNPSATASSGIYEIDGSANGSSQGYSTKAWGNQGQPYSPGGGGSALRYGGETSGNTGTADNGVAGEGLTGNNSGAGTFKQIRHTKYDYGQYDYIDAGSASGSSGVVLLKW